MNLLAFDTSTETLSVAVQHGAQVLEHSGPGGAQASTTLIPAIRALLAQAGLTFARLDAVVFGRGPGSFTGLRTACSVAQGLAWGAGVPVLPVDTLLAVAEAARQSLSTAPDSLRVLALLDARMGEVYAAGYAWSPADGWQALADAAVLPPEAVAVPPAGTLLAGNAAAVYAERLPAALLALPRADVLPTADALLSLAPALLAAGRAVPAEQALPLYIRDKVAQTTAERAAAGLAR